MLVLLLRKQLKPLFGEMALADTQTGEIVSTQRRGVHKGSNRSVPPTCPPLSGGRDWGGGRARIGASETLALPGIGDCSNPVNVHQRETLSQSLCSLCVFVVFYVFRRTWNE